MSIYSISNWSAGTYNTNDIVRYPANTNNFYYGLTDGNTNTPSPSSTSWGGVSSFNGIVKPKFIWKTNYGITAQHEPTTLKVVFGDMSEQRIVQNINNGLISLNLSFDLRSEKETAAIIHFLFSRRAEESFLFTPSPPHDLEKLWVCRTWNEQYIFQNNHSISCVFDEVAN